MIGGVADMMRTLRVDGGGPFWLAVLGILVTVVCNAAFPFWVAGRRGLVVAASAGLGLVLSACVLLVERGRVELLLHPSTSDPSQVATNLVRGISLQMNGLALLCSCGVLFVLSGFAIGVPSWLSRVRKNTSLDGFIASVAVATFVFLVLQPIALWVLTVVRAWAALAASDSADKSRVFYDGLAEAGHSLDAGTLFVLLMTGTLVVTGVILAVRAAPAQRIIGVLPLAGAVLLFGLGVGAFAATRSLVYDGTHVLEPLSDDVSWLGKQALIEVADCGPGALPLMPAPILSVSDHLQLNGTKLGSSTEMHEDLVMLANNYALLHPDAKTSELCVLLLVAPTAPIANVLDALTHLPEGYEPKLVMKTTRFTDTRTLGRIGRPRACVYAIPPAARTAVYADTSAFVHALTTAPSR